MKKPWHIWVAFLICLASITVAMSWLSITTMRLEALRETDRVETELARREAELQERISSALYRMDLMLVPLIAQEAGRPYYLYDPFYHAFNPALETPAGGGTGGEMIPSPLLFQPPRFVRVHFQIGPGNRISSPQQPKGAELRQATSLWGVSPADIVAIGHELELAGEFCLYEPMLGEFVEVENPALANAESRLMNFRTAQNPYNVPAIEQIRQTIENNSLVQTEQPPTQQGKKIDVQRSRVAGRTSEEFNRRNEMTQALASQPWANNAYSNQAVLENYSQSPRSKKGFLPPPDIQQGVMKPMWLSGHLILARRVDGKADPIVQCCWLDWEAIQVALQDRVRDLLPAVDFQPLKPNTEFDSGLALTTIPARLVIDVPEMLSMLAIDSNEVEPSAFGLKSSLLVAWLGFVLAALASAFLLMGVIRLSERRATFASAVTHELRTPLTTFRMYAEMMAEDMVPEEKRKEYATTLKIQADRLSHLVENVLQFARLEQGPQANCGSERVKLGELFDRFSSRLVERANEAGMSLSIDLEKSLHDFEWETRPTMVEQILFNLVDNACKYAQGATENRIEVSCCRLGGRIRFRVQDHGPGVAGKYKKRMFQPFCKSDLEAANSAPGVGLGLALCQRMARSLGGRLAYEDGEVGATFVLELPAGS